jgi:Iap family predicted aminopeptidase
MKRVKNLWIITVLSLVLVMAPTQQSHAIVWVVVQAAMKKVIRAMDLAVQKLQNKTVWLQNAQKTLENTLSKLKLEEISDWTKKNKEQYQKYYEELSKIKGYISNYQRVRSLMEKQVRIVSEYRRAFDLFKRDKHFSQKEIAYMAKIYTGILNESVQTLDQLLSLIRDHDLIMTDGKRLELISTAANRMDTVLSDLRLFNQQNIKLTLQRASDLEEVNALKQIYGLE